MKSTALSRYLIQREIDGEEVAAAAAQRRREVAHLIQQVGRSLHAFNYKDEHYLPPAIDKAVRECEAAFAADDYDRAEHLAKVVGAMVARIGPQFAADPQTYIIRKELREW